MTLSPDPGLATAPSPNCLLCGRPGHLFFAGLEDRLFEVPGQWSMRTCAGCGLTWLDPQPVEAEMGKAYHRYYTHAGEDPVDRVGPRVSYPHRKVRRLYRWVLRRLGVMAARDRLLGMFLDGMPRGTLLEVGCGNGLRLSQLAQDGWQVTGQDVDPSAADHALARYVITVRVGPLAELGLPSEAFDCILMNHVVEHLHDPVGVLRECHRLLKPGGRLVVVTPNIASLGVAVFGPHWRGLEPPRHIHLFSPTSLLQLASQAGFSQLEAFSSVAHAELFASQSLNLRLHGTTVMGAEPSWAVEWRAMAFQIREAWACRTAPDLGEEAVLIARRD